MLRPVARAAVRWVPSDIPMLSKPYRQMELARIIQQELGKRV
jgi:hypothetical protein